MLLFGIPYFGKQYLPIIFNNWYIQWAAIILLAILLPIGFASSLIKYLKSGDKSSKSLSIPIVFLFIYSVLLLYQMPIRYINESLFNVIDSVSIGHDTNLLERTYKGKSEEERYKSAKIIFYEFGKKVPYILKNGKYVVFKPSKEDILKFDETNKLRKKTILYRNQIKNMNKQSLYIQVIEIIFFFIMVSFTIFFAGKTEYHSFKKNIEQ